MVCIGSNFKGGLGLNSLKLLVSGQTSALGYTACCYLLIEHKHALLLLRAAALV